MHLTAQQLERNRVRFFLNFTVAPSRQLIRPEGSGILGLSDPIF